MDLDELDEKVMEAAVEQGGRFRSFKCPDDTLVGPGDGVTCEVVAMDGARGKLKASVEGDDAELRVTLG